MVRSFTQIDEVVPYDFPPVQMTRDQYRQRYRAGPVLVSIYPDMRHSLLLHTVEEAHSESQTGYLPSRTAPAPPPALAHALSTDLQRSIAGSTSLNFQCEPSGGELPPPFFPNSLGNQSGSSSSAGTSAEGSPVRLLPSVEERYARIRDHVAQYIQNVRRREAAASLRSTLINERTSLLSSRGSGMVDAESNQNQEGSQRAGTSSMPPPVSRAGPQSADNSSLIPPVDFSTLVEPIPVSNLWRSNRRRRYALDFDSLESHEPTLPRRMSRGPFPTGLPLPPVIPMQATGDQPEIDAGMLDGGSASADRIPILSRLLVEHLNSASTRPVDRSSSSSGMEMPLDPLGRSSSRFVRLWRDAWPAASIIAAPEESRVTASPLPPLSSALRDARVDPPRMSLNSTTIQNAALDDAFSPPPSFRPLEPGTSVIRGTGSNSTRGSRRTNDSGGAEGTNRSSMINDAFTEFAQVAERAFNDAEAGNTPPTFPSASNLNPFLRMLESHEDAMRELTSEVQDLASRWRMIEERLNPNSQGNPVRDILRSLRNMESPSPRNDLLVSNPNFEEDYVDRYQSQALGGGGEPEQLSGMEAAMERTFSLSLDERARLNRLRQGVHILLENANGVEQMDGVIDNADDDDDDDEDDDEEEEEESEGSGDDGEDDEDDDDEENADTSDGGRGAGAGMYDAYDEPFTDDGEADHGSRRDDGHRSVSGPTQSGRSHVDGGDLVPAFEYYYWMLMRAPAANRNESFLPRQTESTYELSPEWAEWIMTMELLERIRAGVKSMAEQIRRQQPSQSFFRQQNVIAETQEAETIDQSSSEPLEVNDGHEALPRPVIGPSSNIAASSSGVANVTASPAIPFEMMRSGMEAISSARKRKREMDDLGEVTVR
ncbi:hypothetical protein BJ742DRAFT_516403 [Cladochytrium replicatum]|nr:hypothetical protein BJ742DRAFT_516403 [Cladochytrium replicatum]